MSSDISKDDRILIDGELVSVAAVAATPSGFECIVKSPTRGLFEVFIRPSEVPVNKMAASDGSGDSGRAITAVWAKWMEWAIPRIRSAVLATRPLKPYAHQDDAVFGVMLSQPRLRFLLADEPGTGKTLMSGMYIAEARRRGLVPGRVVIVVPAHLVVKWIRELKRFLGIDVHGDDRCDLAWLDSRRAEHFTSQPTLLRDLKGGLVLGARQEPAHPLLESDRVEGPDLAVELDLGRRRLPVGGLDRQSHVLTLAGSARGHGARGSGADGHLASVGSVVALGGALLAPATGSGQKQREQQPTAGPKGGPIVRIAHHGGGTPICTHHDGPSFGFFLRLLRAGRRKVSKRTPCVVFMPFQHMRRLDSDVLKRWP